VPWLAEMMVLTLISVIITQYLQSDQVLDIGFRVVNLETNLELMRMVALLVSGNQCLLEVGQVVCLPPKIVASAVVISSTHGDSLFIAEKLTWGCLLL
jgi:hypothetical protein